MARAAQLRTAPGLGFGKIQSANNEFHRALLAMSGSPRLIAICSALVDTPMIIGSFHLYDDDEIFRSIEQHDQINRSISARDYDYSFQCMSIHLRATHDIYVKA